MLDLTLPTRVRSGRGRLAELGTLAAKYGDHALVVTGRTAMREHGVLDRVCAILEQAGVRVTVHDAISPDPRAEEVDAAAHHAVREQCSVVIGVGGGSAIDAAKATAAGMRCGPVGPLVGRTVPPPEDPVPVIAVPTTAGSGAEVTCGAIITDEARGLKSGIRGEFLFPVAAIVDPELASTMPREVAAETAFDALAHLVEGLAAARSTPVSRGFAAQALPVLARRIPELATPDLPSDEHRDDMATVALLGGYSVATASTCLPHRLQQAMGAVPVRISHGRGLAALYPAWLRRAGEHALDAFAEADRLLGGDGDLVATVEQIRTSLGVASTLADLGFAGRDLEVMTGAVQGNLDNDPIPDVSEHVLRRIYEESM